MPTAPLSQQPLRAPTRLLHQQNNHPFRILPNWTGKTATLSMPDLLQDLLPEQWNRLSRLKHRRATFDEVAALSVEGVNKSSIARVKQPAWNTVDRWLEKAAAVCRRFNQQRIKEIYVRELQADEIRTIAQKENSPVWIFVA